jgi:hypothetical protein
LEVFGMSKRSDTALMILQLLLRCGMICQEELDIVLEMMVTAQGSNKAIPLSTEVSGARSRQSTLVFEFD